MANKTLTELLEHAHVIQVSGENFDFDWEDDFLVLQDPNSIPAYRASRAAVEAAVLKERQNYWTIALESYESYDREAEINGFEDADATWNEAEEFTVMLFNLLEVLPDPADRVTRAEQILMHFTPESAFGSVEGSEIVADIITYGMDKGWNIDAMLALALRTVHAEGTK